MKPKPTGPGEPVTSNNGSGPDKFPPTLESRPGLERPHRAVNMLTAAERRLVWKYTTSGEAWPPARLRVLVFLASEKEVKHGTLAREADLNPASVTAMIEQPE